MTAPLSLQDCLDDLPDPRVSGRCTYKLTDVIIIAICGVLCGADSWVGVEMVGREKEDWFREFLDLEHGIPSHDTFGDVFAMIDAEAFQKCFMRWVEQVFKVSRGQVIALDGKTLRGSHDKTIGKDAIHMVSAWASQNGLVLGQRQVASKSNEITAIPELLNLLNVTGCIVTIDAMGCQTAIAQSIRDRGADYVLRVKDNQNKLRQDIEDGFVHGDQQAFSGMQMDYHRRVTKTSGCVEVRQCWVMTDSVAFEYIRHYDDWADLNSIIRVHRQVHHGAKVTEQTAYYISSLTASAQTLLDATQHHWAVENSFHWVLDVTFREDHARNRLGNSPANMAVVRSVALNLLKHDSSKHSLKQKRFKAAMNNNFLLKLLTQV